LQSAVSAEETARINADSVLQAAVSDEETARISADNAEESARIAADSVLQTAIADEEAARASADNAEETARIAGDSVLQAAISAEESARISADSAEESARIAGDSALQTAVSDEESARVAADSVLQAAVSDEESDRISADSALQAALSAEETARVAGDAALQTAASAEEAARLAGDAALQTGLAAEEAARQAEGSALQTALDSHAGDGGAHVSGSQRAFLDMAMNAGIVPNTANVFRGNPDYSKMEAENRISANGGSWTADRDGYVCCAFNAYNTCRAYVQINGKTVSSAVLADIAQVIQHADVFPVSAGDTVSIGASPNNMNSYGCYFIPPREAEFPCVTIGLVQSSAENGKVSIDPATREMALNGYPFVPMLAGGIASYAPTNKTYWPANASVTSAAPLIGPWFSFTVPVYLTLSLYSNAAGAGICYALDVENIRTGSIADPYSAGVHDAASGVFNRGMGLLLPANARARIRVLCTASGSVSWAPANSNGGLLLVSGVIVAPLYGA
jgi:hypothetical protein